VGGFEPPTSWSQTTRSYLAELHPEHPSRLRARHMASSGPMVRPNSSTGGSLARTFGERRPPLTVPLTRPSTEWLSALAWR
jgi:hypothetical protein